MSPSFRAAVLAPVLVGVVLVAAGCSTSSGGSGPSGSAGRSSATVDPADIAAVFTAARSGFEVIHDRDFSQPQAWFARVRQVTADPLQSSLAVQAANPTEFPQRGRTFAKVTHTALVSLSSTSAYVIVVATETATSKAVGISGTVPETVGLDRVGNTWLLSQDGASGVPGIDQSFASDAERAAMKAAAPAYLPILEVGINMFDAKFAEPAAGFTKAGKSGYVASKEALRAQVTRNKILSQDARLGDVGLERSTSTSVTLIVPWSADVRHTPTQVTLDQVFGVGELSMSKVSGTWLIGGIRELR